MNRERSEEASRRFSFDRKNVFDCVCMALYPHQNSCSLFYPLVMLLFGPFSVSASCKFDHFETNSARSKFGLSIIPLVSNKFGLFQIRPVSNLACFKGAVSYFTHIFFSFFLAFLQTSYGFILIKTYKLHYFYLSLHSETTNRGEITVTTMFLSGLDLCIFPCFKCIACQVNSFALIAK